MTDHTQQTIEEFFAQISPWEAAYVHGSFKYFAVLQGNQFNLLKGEVLLLATPPPPISKSRFQSSRVRAGHFTLAEMGMGYRELVTQLIAGRVHAPDGELVFPKDDGNRITAYLTGFDQEGIRIMGGRFTVLNLAGAGRYSFVKQPDLDWELKAAPIPFDSLSDLLAEFQIGAFQGDLVNVEVKALPVAVVHPDSRVEGEIATLSVSLGKSLEPRKCSIGYCVFLQGKVSDRGSLSGEVLDWSEDEQFKLGRASLNTPRGAVLHCYASYNGYAQHQCWIADPSTFQNPKRAVLEGCDERLEILKDFLFEEQKPRKEARDFEFGVEWLLWMMGFSVAHLGGTKRTEESLDLIATTPRGNLLAIECTTGLLKTENKLAKLVQRAEVLRKTLESSGLDYLSVLPAIITSKTREEVRADLDQAQNLRVLVMTKESLLSALEQSLVSLDPDVVFDKAFTSLNFP